jgi:type IV secretion system protein VirD4
MAFKKMWDGRKHEVEDASDYGAHGTSRFSTEKEIFDEENISDSFTEKGTLLASYHGKPVILKDASWKNKNIAVFGGSGTGKSRSFVIPNILFSNDKSIVVTDPKGELFELTSEAKKAQGYNVKMINFKEMDVSDRYNPLDYIREEIDARRVAVTIVMNSSNHSEPENSFWDKAEVALLSAFILFVKFHLPTEQQHFGSVFNLVTAPYAKTEEFFMGLEGDHIAKKAYNQAIAKMDEKVRANVFISLAVTLDIWKYEKICSFTYQSDFLLPEIAKEKTIVYVILPVGEREFRPLISSFFTQLFSELYKLADKHSGKLPIATQLILDEFNNIGRLPNFEERQSTARGLRLEITMIIQSIGQLRDRYGHEKADELIDNCDTRVFLGTNTVNSAKYFSDLLGVTTKRIQSVSENKGDRGESQGESRNVISRPLMTPDELLRLGDHNAIVFMRGKFPFYVQKAWFDTFPFLVNMLQRKVSPLNYPAPQRRDYSVFEVCDNKKQVGENVPEITKYADIESI